MASPELKVRVLADLSQFKSQMKGVRSALKDVGKGVARTGKMVTALGTTAMVGFGATSIRAFDQQAKAIAQVETGLKSTGGQVGRTSKQLQQMASDLQSKTLFGDEVILKDATAQLLTFTNIAGEQFDKTQVAVLDLATRLDGDLKSASIQLGKALNDPVANLSALSRSGIQFSKSQKDVINSLVESGRLADAQNIILEELEKQYGGSAEAAAEAGAGGLKQLQNAFSDLQEGMGAVMVEAILPMAERLKEFFELMQKQTPETKKRFVLLASAIGVLGPALIGLGIAMQFVMSPVTAIAVGIAGLVVLFDYTRRNAEAFKNGFVRIFQNMKLQVLLRIREMMEGMDGIFSKIGIDILEGPMSKIDEMILNTAESIKETAEGPELQSFKEYWKDVGGDVKGLVADLMAISPVAEKAGNAIKRIEAPKVDRLGDTEPEQGIQAPRFRSVAPVFVEAIPPARALFEMLSKIRISAESLTSVIRTQLSNAFFSLGDTLSSVFTGDANATDFFNSILRTVASFAIEFGRLAIAIGTSALAIKESLLVNPLLAIGAGVALVTLGSAIQKLASDGPARMAEGGIVPRGFPNDTYPALLTSGEMVVPKPHALPSMGGAVEVFGEFRVRGSDLVTAISNTNNRTLR